MARDDLRAAELLGEHGIAPLARMHADQAVEKALRALHLHREGQNDGTTLESPSLSAFSNSAVSTRSGPGAERGWMAAALASLSPRARHRQPAGEDGEAELAREAVQVAHRVLDRITERVYG